MKDKMLGNLLNVECLVMLDLKRRRLKHLLYILGGQIEGRKLISGQN